MKPEDILKYSEEMSELLKDASYKPVKFKGGIDPYATSNGAITRVKVTDHPFTIAWVFGWTPQLETQRAGWEHLIMGFKLALATVYKDIPVAHSMINEVADGKLFPLVMSQLYAKMRRAVRGPLVYLEADVLCNRPCNPFEGMDYDIGLTDSSEKWPMMPFNAGVMFANDTDGAQKFLDTAMEYACNIPQNMAPWYAYQLGISHAYLALKDKISIKIFPSEKYNFNPTIYAPTDAYFVHLKGDRKKLQRDFIKPILEAADVEGEISEGGLILAK